MFRLPKSKKCLICFKEGYKKLSGIMLCKKHYEEKLKITQNKA